MSQINSHQKSEQKIKNIVDQFDMFKNMLMATHPIVEKEGLSVLTIIYGTSGEDDLAFSFQNDQQVAPQRKLGMKELCQIEELILNFLPTYTTSEDLNMQEEELNTSSPDLDDDQDWQDQYEEQDYRAFGDEENDMVADPKTSAEVNVILQELEFETSLQVTEDVQNSIMENEEPEETDTNEDSNFSIESQENIRSKYSRKRPFQTLEVFIEHDFSRKRLRAASGSISSPVKIIVEDPLLATYELVYNSKYHFIMCKPCQSVVPLEYLSTHLQQKCHQLLRNERKLSKLKALKSSILEAFPNLIMKKRSDVVELYDKTLRGKKGQKDLIPLMPIHDGFLCLECEESKDSKQYATRSFKSAKKHAYECHQNVKDKWMKKKGIKKGNMVDLVIKSASVQSLAHRKDDQISGGSLIQYFWVKSSSDLNNEITTRQEDSEFEDHPLPSSILSAFNYHRQNLIGQDLGSHISSMEQSTIIHSFFTTQSGALLFIKSLTEKQLERAINPPHSQGMALLRLAMAKMLVDNSPKIEHNRHLRQYILQKNPGTEDVKSKGKMLSAPSKECMARYAYDMFGIIRLIFVAYEDSISSNTGREPFMILNQPQTSSVFELNRRLKKLAGTEKKKASQDHKLHQAILKLLNTLVMPEDVTSLAENDFNSPIISGLCISSWKSEGGFHEPSLICSRISGIQFVMRMVVYLSGLALNYQIDEDRDRENIYLLKIQKHCTRWLDVGGLNPFNALQFWNRSLSAIVFNSPPQSRIIWLNEDEAKLDGQHLLSLSHIRHGLKHEIAELSAFIEKEVLLGLSIESFAMSLDITDTRDTKTPGYGPTSGSTSQADSGSIIEASLPLTSKLVEKKIVKMIPITEEPDRHTAVWLVSKTPFWLYVIDQAWCRLAVLIHILGGLPARATELLMMQHTNGVQSRRHLFSHGNGLLHLLSNYNKTTKQTGKYKEILRLLPHQISTLVYVLLAIVRPLETAAVIQTLAPTSRGPSNKQRQIEMAILYNQCIFVSYGKAWDSSRLTPLLKTFFKKATGAEIGVNGYRHYAASLRRKFIKNAPDKLDPKTEAAIAQMGHGPKVDEKYGIEAGDRSIIPLSQQSQFEVVSKDWQSLWHIPTYSEDQSSQSSSR